MLFTTHVKLGRYLLEVLDMNIYHPEEFIKGLYQPDFKVKDFGWPHTEVSTFNIMKTYLHDLNHIEISDKKFSYTLGVICHYIQDYMCSYHKTSTDYHKLFKHVIYEIGGELKWIFNKPADKLRDKILDILYEFRKMRDSHKIKDINISLYISSYIDKRWEADIYFDQNEDAIESLVLCYMTIQMICYKARNKQLIY
jgi:hypothetical protein